ncbi:hypothetical protein, partial [Micromonospora sp. NPDC048830]|uniref:hypothetical protein n=1 Tax=Micromonospora sp. NPDC048830 TaxID=3364257 RepID=UPI00371B924B
MAAFDPDTPAEQYAQSPIVYGRRAAVGLAEQWATGCPRPARCHSLQNLQLVGSELAADPSEDGAFGAVGPGVPDFDKTATPFPKSDIDLIT